MRSFISIADLELYIFKYVILLENNIIMWKKIKSKILVTLVVLCTGLFTSCFDFIEDITLKQDGSGSIKAVLNLSASKTQVATLLKLDAIGGNKIPSQKQIEDQTQEVVNILKNSKGITNVRYDLDFNNYIASLSCDFSSLEDLNHFSATLARHFNSTVSKNVRYSYDRDKSKLSKEIPYQESYTKVLEKLSQEDIQKIQKATYTQVFKFEQSVESTHHLDSKISPNKKAVLLQVSIVDFIQGKTSLSNTINLNNK